MNILKYMYSTRFKGGSTRTDTSLEAQTNPITVTPSLISTLETGHPDKFRKRKGGGEERSVNSLNITSYYLGHLVEDKLSWLTNRSETPCLRQVAPTQLLSSIGTDHVTED